MELTLAVVGILSEMKNLILTDKGGKRTNPFST
jgi:hypothetical protein